MYKTLFSAALLLFANSAAFCADATLEAKVGEQFTIVRPENSGSTGYSWAQNVADSNVVAYKSKRYDAPAQQMPGAKGTQHFTFEAKKSGHTTITLELRRPWEKEQAPAETYTVDVTITPQYHE